VFRIRRQLFFSYMWYFSLFYFISFLSAGNACISKLRALVNYRYTRIRSVTVSRPIETLQVVDLSVRACHVLTPQCKVLARTSDSVRTTHCPAYDTPRVTDSPPHPIYRGPRHATRRRIAYSFHSAQSPVSVTGGEAVRQLRNVECVVRWQS